VTYIFVNQTNNIEHYVHIGIRVSAMYTFLVNNLIYCIPVLEGSGGGGFLVRWCPGQDGSVRPESWEGTGDGPGNPWGVYKGMPFFDIRRYA